MHFRGSFCCSLINEFFISASNMNDLYKTKALMQRAVCSTTSFYVRIRNKYVYCTYKYG